MLKLPKSVARAASAFMIGTAIVPAAMTAVPMEAAAQTAPVVGTRTINGITIQRYQDGNLITSSSESLFFHENRPGNVDYIVVTPNGQRAQTVRPGTPTFDAAAQRGIRYLQQAGIIAPDGSAAPAPQSGYSPGAPQVGGAVTPINYGNAGATARENDVLIRQYTGGYLVVNEGSGDAIFISSMDGRVARGTADRSGIRLESYALGDPRAIPAIDTAQSLIRIFSQQQSQTLGTSNSTRRLGTIIDRDLGRAIGDAQRFERDRQRIDREQDRPFAQLATRAITSARTANTRAARDMTRGAPRTSTGSFSGSSSSNNGSNDRQGRDLANMAARATPSRTDRALFINGQWQVCDANARGQVRCFVPTAGGNR